MQITDNLKIDPVNNTTEHAINVETGALVVTMETEGASSNITIAEPSKLIVPLGSTLTFALNGDTATITRL